MRPSRLTLGQRAETLAAEHLSSVGYRILCRNWRNPHGEIDLVATQDDTLVFVEVRSRTGTEHGHALETIRQQKRAQIIRAARHFLDTERPCAQAFRFDVVSVTFEKDSEGSPPELIHIENAIQTDL